MKIKKRIAAAAAFILVITILTGAFTGCSKQEEGAPDGYKSASNDRVDYSLYVPADWVVDTAPESQLTAARVSEYDSSNISMTAYVDEDGDYKSVDEYWETYKETLSGVFDKKANEQGDRVSTFTVVKPSENAESDGENCLLGGAGAVKYVYTATMGGIELKYMQVIALKNSTFYIFTYTASADKYSEDTVSGILENFKFK